MIIERLCQAQALMKNKGLKEKLSDILPLEMKILQSRL